MIEILQEFIIKAEENQWYPTLPIPQDVFTSDWPYLHLDFIDDFESMYQECLANDKRFVPHRQLDKHLSYNHEGWAALTLHGISYDKTEHFTQYGYNSLDEADYHWTEVCEFFPYTVNFLKKLNYHSYDRVRIMKLSAGGYIMPHSDGVGRIFGPLNIAINNPIGCNFYFRKWGKVPFKQGRGCFLDIANEHIVYNNSNQDRYHIIVHGDLNYDLIKEAFKQIG